MNKELNNYDKLISSQFHNMSSEICFKKTQNTCLLVHLSFFFRQKTQIIEIKLSKAVDFFLTYQACSFNFNSSFKNK